MTRSAIYRPQINQRLTAGPAGLILRIRCGAIAQLGERLHGMQEVRGSIPRSSTNHRLGSVHLKHFQPEHTTPECRIDVLKGVNVAHGS